jgi:internalin A
MQNKRLQTALFVLCVATTGCIPPTIAQVASKPVDEAAIVNEIKALGGKAYWEERIPAEPITAVQFFSTSKVTDEDMKLLSNLKSLSWLRLDGGKVTGKGLAELKDLKHFETLYWMGRGSAQNLESLIELTNLRELGIYRETTDADLNIIKQMTNLKTLSVHGPKITDAGLREVKEMSGLEQLSIGRTEITDSGMKELKEMNNLQMLDLSRTGITDAGLKELKELKNLQSLYLDCTAITDAGLKELKDVHVLSIGFGESTPNPELTELSDASLIEIGRMPNIRELTIRGHNFTDAGLNALKGKTGSSGISVRGYQKVGT